MATDTPDKRHNIVATSKEKDLGIVFSNNLKFGDHISQATLKANVMIGKLKRTFKTWNVKTFKILYSSYVRPHLEYAAPAWSPYNKKDIKALEKVQRRATKLVPCLSNLSYYERLKALNLTTLEARRLRGDLIQYFKFERGLNFISWEINNRNIYSLQNEGPAGNTRGPQHRLYRDCTKNCKQREYFFLNRIIPHWNNLPDAVISSVTVNQFKNRLDKHLLPVDHSRTHPN